MQLIDTHAHIASQEFSADIEDVLARAVQASVTRIICVASGSGFQSCYDTAEFIKSRENIWGTAGVHPLDATTPIDEDQLLSLASQNKIVAIGETGLDYFYASDTKELQHNWLRTHIRIAKKLKKPLIIHARDAAKDCLEILTQEHAEEVGGVFHCYAEDATFAKTLASINFMVSFTGVLTFKKSTELQKAAKEIPIEQIMLETDSPYLAPVPYRGKRCEPAYTLETAKFLASLKEMPLEEVASITTKNAERFFNLPQQL